MRTYFSVSLIALCTLVAPARAQESGVGFLRIGTSAAAMALGDASVALSRDAFSTYWNPAGLAATSNSVAGSHHLWVNDVRTYNFAARLPAGTRGGLGLFASAASAGGPNGNAPLDPDEGADIQFVNAGAAYAYTFGTVRAGVALKYLSDRNPGYRTSGFAADLGVQADLLREALRLGVAVQNVGHLRELAETVTPLPAMLRAGAAVFPFRVLASEGGDPLLNTFLTGEVSRDLTDTQQTSEEYKRTRMHVGAGAEVFDLVTVRAGYVIGYAFRHVSLGAGIGQGPFQVDYAFLPFEGGYGTGHVLSLAYRWE